MPNRTIYHQDYYLSIELTEPISVVIGLPELLYPISSFDFIADFRLMLKSDPELVEWNSAYSYSYRYTDEETGKELYGLRSLNNQTVILLDKSKWQKMRALFEKVWPVFANISYQ